MQLGCSIDSQRIERYHLLQKTWLYDFENLHCQGDEIERRLMVVVINREVELVLVLNVLEVLVL